MTGVKRQKTKEILGVAAAYCVVGRISLLLAIAPGYATAVWPPAGLALAGVLIFGYRVWPGVVLGSFLVNVWTSLNPADLSSILRSVAIAGGIGAGAGLQAVLGAFLVRRYVGYPNPLDHAERVFKFLTLAGPISCLVSPTLGVTAILAAGAIHASNYPLNWFTWWVGDTVGALIFAPVAVVGLGRAPRVPLRRKLLITGPVFVSFTLVIVLFIEAGSWEQKRIQLDFDQRADELVSRLLENLDRHLDVLYSIRNLFESYPDVDRQAFRTFVRPMFARYPGLQALEWLPRVPAAERDLFEECVRHEGYPRFEITESVSEGHMVRAKRRREYFPVDYVEPYQGNEIAFGFDVASDPFRSQALRKAAETGQPAATRRITLVQETGHQFGLLVFLPVYGARGRRADEAMERRKHARRQTPDGFVLEVFRMGDLVQASLGRAGARDTQMCLYDDTAPIGKRLLYTNPVSARLTGEEQRSRTGAIERVSTFRVAGRRWTLEITPTPMYLASHLSWQAWTILAGGLLFTAVLGALLLVVTGYTAQVEKVVAERTEQLLNSNTELRRFAYVASHDLQEPLRAVAGFAQLLATRYRDKLDAEAHEFIAFMVEGVKRMQALINDLATYYAVGTRPPVLEPVDCHEMVEGVLREVQETVQASGAWVMSVTDNGIGIDAQFWDQIFDPFKRLHSRGEYAGTGCGLAICKKIVENHGGRIWVKSQPGRGSAFFFTWPCRASGAKRDEPPGLS
jgi:signal transduction histidine kinase